MQPFTYQSHAMRILFRDGALQDLAAEVSRLGKRALVLTTPPQRAMGEQVRALIGSVAVGIYDQAVMHVPTSTVAEARKVAADLGADMTIAVGGGSTIGLAKALALEPGLPILAVPTTYAGSEMTPVWGMTENGLKTTGRDSRVVPSTVVYDPLLTRSLPVAMAVTSGINAIAHCAEGLYSETANPVTSLMAEEGIRVIARSLPRLIDRPDDADARAQALYGAWLGGTVLGTVGMALHHKLCHTLGGTFGLPHSETHTVILPHVLAYNAAAAPEAMARIAQALGADNAAQGLFALLQQVGAPTALRDLGMPEEGIAEVVRLAVTNPYYNPAPLDAQALTTLLTNAWAGKPPEQQAFA